MSRFSLKRLLPAAIALLLVAASSVHHCNAQTSELTAALRRVGVQDSHGDGDNLQNAVRSSYRRQLTRAEYEEIKITKGKYDGESLNSDDFKIVFKVGDGIGENIRCLIVRSPEVVVAEMVPCTSPIKLKGRLTVDGMYGVGIFGTTLLTGETIEVTSIWHLDTVPPNTLLTAEPKDTAKTTVEFTFIGFDENEREEHGPLTFQCSLDNEKWKNCTSPRTVSVATPGAHNFRVRARDRAGNADPYPDVYEWEVARTQSSSTNPVSPSPSPSPSAVASPSPSPSPSAVVSPSPSPSPSVVPSPSPSPSPSVVPSPSPSPSVVPSPSPSPSVVPSPSPSPSVVPSPSPSPSPSPVFVPSTSETVTEQNPTVTTLSEEVAPDTVDSTGVSNSGISRGSSSHSDRTVTNEIIAAVVVIPSLVVIIGGIYFLKKQTEERQQMEEEAMADNGIIKTKTVDAPLPDINVEDSERSYSEKSYSQASYSGRSLSERSMPE